MFNLLCFYQGTLNEQLHIHSAECRYSCGIHSGEHPYSYEMCNKTLSQQSNLITHQRTHSPERPNTCDVCNKAFFDKSTLGRHQRIHSGDRPYACGVCNRAFIEKSGLIKHARIHTDECPYVCEMCNKAFRHQSSLIRHERIHRGMYVCDVCNKAFRDESGKRNHQRVHSVESPVRCDVCDKAFSKQTSLISHKRIHSREGPFTCDVCNNAFSIKSSLIKHQRIHSGERPWKFHFFTVPKKKYEWQTITFEILWPAVRHRYKQLLQLKQKQIFHFHTNFCGKMCGKVKCMLNPTCMFDLTEDVDLVTGWTEWACCIEGNVIWSGYIDQIRVNSSESWFTSCTLEVTPSVMRHFNTKLCRQ